MIFVILIVFITLISLGAWWWFKVPEPLPISPSIEGEVLDDVVLPSKMNLPVIFITSAQDAEKYPLFEILPGTINFWFKPTKPLKYMYFFSGGNWQDGGIIKFYYNNDHFVIDKVGRNGEKSKEVNIHLALNIWYNITLDQEGFLIVNNIKKEFLPFSEAYTGRIGLFPSPTEEYPGILMDFNVYNSSTLTDEQRALIAKNGPK